MLCTLFQDTVGLSLLLLLTAARASFSPVSAGTKSQSRTVSQPMSTDCELPVLNTPVRKIKTLSVYSVPAELPEPRPVGAQACDSHTCGSCPCLTLHLCSKVPFSLSLNPSLPLRLIHRVTWGHLHKCVF